MNTAETGTEALLRCESLHKRFHRRVVLEDISLSVEAGDALVLLGSSGAGKTTLLRILAGLESVDEGRVLLGPQVLSSAEVQIPPEARGIGMVFQALELWSQMSVAEHIAFGIPGRPRGRRARRHPLVRELAAEVGLDEILLRRRPETLSGGEQQRVAIARTLAARPDVILYDEPLANLDPDRRRALRALIRRLARTHGTTLVYVTHDPEEALEIGDQVVVLSGGQIVESGSPQQLYRAPRTLAGAQALGPITAVPASWRDGVVDTPFGALETRGETARPASGTCVALLRPDALWVDGGARAEVRVEDVVARGFDWAFQGRLGEATVYGRSDEALEAGDVVRVRADGPVAVLEAEPAQGASR